MERETGIFCSLRAIPVLDDEGTFFNGLEAMGFDL